MTQAAPVDFVREGGTSGYEHPETQKEAAPYSISARVSEGQNGEILFDLSVNDHRKTYHFPMSPPTGSETQISPPWEATSKHPFSFTTNAGIHVFKIEEIVPGLSKTEKGSILVIIETQTGFNIESAHKVTLVTHSTPPQFGGDAVYVLHRPGETLPQLDGRYQATIQGMNRGYLLNLNASMHDRNRDVVKRLVDVKTRQPLPGSTEGAFWEYSIEFMAGKFNLYQTLRNSPDNGATVIQRFPPKPLFLNAHTGTLAVFSMNQNPSPEGLIIVSLDPEKMQTTRMIVPEWMQWSHQTERTTTTRSLIRTSGFGRGSVTVPPFVQPGQDDPRGLNIHEADTRTQVRKNGGPAPFPRALPPVGTPVAQPAENTLLEAVLGSLSAQDLFNREVEARDKDGKAVRFHFSFDAAQPSPVVIVGEYDPKTGESKFCRPYYFVNAQEKPNAPGIIELFFSTAPPNKGSNEGLRVQVSLPASSITELNFSYFISFKHMGTESIRNENLLYVVTGNSESSDLGRITGTQSIRRGFPTHDPRFEQNLRGSDGNYYMIRHIRGPMDNGQHLISISIYTGDEKLVETTVFRTRRLSDHNLVRLEEVLPAGSAELPEEQRPTARQAIIQYDPGVGQPMAHKIGFFGPEAGLTTETIETEPAFILERQARTLILQQLRSEEGLRAMTLDSANSYRLKLNQGNLTLHRYTQGEASPLALTGLELQRDPINPISEMREIRFFQHDPGTPYRSFVLFFNEAGEVSRLFSSNLFTWGIHSELMQRGQLTTVLPELGTHLLPPPVRPGTLESNRDLPVPVLPLDLLLKTHPEGVPDATPSATKDTWNSPRAASNTAPSASAGVTQTDFTAPGEALPGRELLFHPDLLKGCFFEEDQDIRSTMELARDFENSRLFVTDEVILRTLISGDDDKLLTVDKIQQITNTFFRMSLAVQEIEARTQLEADRNQRQNMISIRNSALEALFQINDYRLLFDLTYELAKKLEAEGEKTRFSSLDPGSLHLIHHLAAYHWRYGIRTQVDHPDSENPGNFMMRPEAIMTGLQEGAKVYLYQALVAEGVKSNTPEGDARQDQLAGLREILKDTHRRLQFREHSQEEQRGLELMKGLVDTAISPNRTSKEKTRELLQERIEFIKQAQEALQRIESRMRGRR